MHARIEKFMWMSQKCKVNFVEVLKNKKIKVQSEYVYK